MYTLTRQYYKQKFIKLNIRNKYNNSIDIEISEYAAGKIIKKLFNKIRTNKNIYKRKTIKFGFSKEPEEDELNEGEYYYFPYIYTNNFFITTKYYDGLYGHSTVLNDIKRINKYKYYNSLSSEELLIIMKNETNKIFEKYKTEYEKFNKLKFHPYVKTVKYMEELIRDINKYKDSFGKKELKIKSCVLEIFKLMKKKIKYTNYDAETFYEKVIKRYNECQIFLGKKTYDTDSDSNSEYDTDNDDFYSY